MCTTNPEEPILILGCSGQIGFYPGEEPSYVDLGVVSIAYDIDPPAEGRWFRESWFIFFAIMQPAIGLGAFTGCESYGVSRSCLTGIMYKTYDNWLPPNFSLSINPNSGYQGTTLTNVHLYADNTTFQDNPPVQIGIESPYGLAVSNTNVISNTEIEFDLDIAIDAPVGLRTVIVTYYYGPHLRPQLRVGTAEFEVFEKAL